MHLHRVVGWVGLLAMLGGLEGCRDEQAGPRDRRSRTLPPAPVARILDAPPSDLSFRSGTSLAGGAVIYWGSKVAQPASGEPGTVRVSHYFTAAKAPPEGFGFFVHLVDEASGQQLANLDHEFQNGALPLGRWPVGKVVEDVHAVLAPPPGRPLRLLLGFWRGDERLSVDGAQGQDGSNRLLGPVLGADSGEAPVLPEYRVARTERPPKIDGLLDDAVWSKASVATLVGSFDGRTPQRKTTLRMLQDGNFLYAAFDVEDPDVWGTFRKRDDPIYTEEVVELFIDANADGRTYNELEVSPHNVVFDAYFPARRQGMDLSFDAQLVTAVKVHGTLDNPNDRDEGWSVELRLPLARLAEVPHLPPRPGDRWRFNAYRLEHLDRREVEGQAFSPLFVGDFHHLPRFGQLVFE